MADKSNNTPSGTFMFPVPAFKVIDDAPVVLPMVIVEANAPVETLTVEAAPVATFIVLEVVAVPVPIFTTSVPVVFPEAMFTVWPSPVLEPNVIEPVPVVAPITMVPVV